MKVPSNSESSGLPQPVGKKQGLSIRRLLVMFAVLAVALGSLWWQKRNEPQPPKPSPEQAVMAAEDALWSRTVATLNAELSTYQRAADAFLKERRERLLAGRFELPLDAHNTATFQRAMADVRRHELQAYRARTADQGAARDAAIEFFEAYFDEIERDAALNDRPSNALAETAREAGAKDPLFRVYRVVGQFVQGEVTPELTAELEAGLDELSAAGAYPMASFVGRRWLSTLAADGKTDRGPERLQAAIEAIKPFAPALTDDPLEPRVKHQQIQLLYRKCDSLNQRRIITALTETPGVDPWLRHQFMGRHMIDAGWLVRGSGYADTVSESQWKGFHEHIDRAAKHLICAWHLHPKFPESPADMITVGKADSKHLPGRFWFFEAAWAQPDYFSAYNQYLDDLLPRWGGSHEQMIEFGVQCVRTGRYDMNVPQYLLLVLSKIGSDLESLGGDPDDCLAVEGAVPALKQLHTEMSQRKDAAGRTLLETTTAATRGSLAKYLALAGEFPSVTEVLDLGGEADDGSHYETMQITGLANRALWRGLAGPHAAEYRALREGLIQLIQADDGGPSPVELQAAVGVLRARDPSEAVAPWFDFVNRRIELRLAFDRGEWVPLPVSEDSGNLWWYWRDWMRIEPNTDVVEFGGSKNGRGIQMALRMRFPVSYEFEAGIEQVAGRAHDRSMGLLLGKHRHLSADQPKLRASLTLFGPMSPIDGEAIDRMRAMVTLDRSFGKPSDYAFRRVADSRLGLMVWPTTFTPVLRGEAFSVPSATLQHFVGTGEIAIGEPVAKFTGPAQHLRVSRPRIRKLPFGPPPPNTAAREVQLPHYTEVVRVHPDDADAHQTLYSLWRGHDDALALRHLERALELAPDISSLHGELAGKHLQNHDFTAALRELEAEQRVTAHNYFVRAWLVKLLLCHPDERLRDPARALKLFESSERAQTLFGGQGGSLLAYARAMVHAERGEFAEALKFLDELEPKVANDHLERQLVAQQRAAYLQRQPFRLDPASLTKDVPKPMSPTTTPTEADIPSALKPENAAAATGAT